MPLRIAVVAMPDRLAGYQIPELAVPPTEFAVVGRLKLDEPFVFSTSRGGSGTGIGTGTVGHSRDRGVQRRSR